MAESLTIRPTVLVPLRNHEAFLDLYVNQGDMGGLMLPPTVKVGVGDQVDLELAFAAEKMVFHVRAIARWRRSKAQPKLPAGVGVEFLPSERRTRDLLLEFAHGKQVELMQRKSRRFPVEIVVEYRTDSVFMTDVTDDLSRDGTFIRCDAPPPVGTELELKLLPPGYRLGIGLQGRVMWHRTGERPGFGIQFVIDKKSTRKKLDELIERIKTHLSATR